MSDREADTGGPCYNKNGFARGREGYLDWIDSGIRGLVVKFSEVLLAFLGHLE